MGTDCAFSVVAWFTLISRTCVSAGFTALTEGSPVIVEWGEMAIFHCRTSIPSEVTEVRWIRFKGGKYSMINLFRDGRDQQTCELPEYVGRTELMTEGLAGGRAALKLLDVSVADEGSYRCYLETADYFNNADVKLRVTALGSYPRIDIEGFQDGGIKVVCGSAGWYPEPTLVNKDDKAEMKIRQEENGLYSIKYSRVLPKDSDRTFTCRFQTSFHRTYPETSVYVADAVFPTSRDPVVIALCIVATVAVATGVSLALYLWAHQRQIRDTVSALRSLLSSLEVPLDQDSSNESEQTTSVCSEEHQTESSCTPAQ